MKLNVRSRVRRIKLGRKLRRAAKKGRPRSTLDMMIYAWRLAPQREWMVRAIFRPFLKKAMEREEITEIENIEVQWDTL